jgi:alpha-glucosidase
VLGNHDRNRVATRIGEAQARVAAMLLLTLRGTPTIYYADELGLPNVPILPSQERDPAGIREPGRSRDPERTPMRWDSSPLAGFTSGEPWLPIGPRVAELNVETERSDPKSMLSFHRRLLDLRRREAALSIGEYVSVGVEGDVMAYERRSGEARFLIVLNLGHEPARLPVAAAALAGTIEASTGMDRDEDAFDGGSPLRGDEGIVVRLHG